MEKIKKLKKMVADITLSLASILLAAVCFSLFFNVLDRFLFKFGLMWVEMFARYGLIWCVFLSANVLIYNDELMRVDFLDNFLPERFKNARSKFYTVAFIIMLLLLMVFGMQQALAYWGVATLGLPVDKFWVYLCIPVGSALMLFQYVTNLFLLYHEGKNSEEKEVSK